MSSGPTHSAGIPPHTALGDAVKISRPQLHKQPKQALFAEWPTWIVWIGCYGGFAALTYFWSALPLWVAIPVLAYLICLNAHLMHEVLHGHPTRNATLNRLLVLPNLVAYIPYEIYRDTHIDHHYTGTLTHPMDDPESFYQRRDAWDGMMPISRWVLSANNSMIGRMLIGPFLMVLGFWLSELRRYARGDRSYYGAWAILIASNLVLGFWLFAVCALPVWQMALAWYFGYALMTVRSFIEHRPSAAHDSSCAIVEAGVIWQLLFLNNSFHLVHHSQPGLAWYKIPAVYRADRDQWRARTEGHWFRGYWEVFLHTALKPKDTPRHPVY